MPKGKQNKTILAMDLSLNGSAFAVLQVYSKTVRIIELVLVDNSKIPANQLPEKLANIYFNLDELFQKYTITDIVREKGFHRYNKVTQKLYKVVGVVDFTLYCNGFNKIITEITPMTVKKIVGGNGHCSKDEVAQGINKFLCRTQKNKVFYETDDLSDAVAVGIAHAVRKKYINAD